jgi:hypothetical protein
MHIQLAVSSKSLEERMKALRNSQMIVHYLLEEKERLKRFIFR